MKREEVLTAVRDLSSEEDFAWDGEDEEERSASREELTAGVQAYRRKRGRPAGSGSKEQVAIRIDRETLRAFRATGRGWQTRMNDALADWLKHHSPEEAGRS